MSDQFIVVAKAGGADEGAENTLGLITQTLRIAPPAGVSLAIEVDARLTADGALVAIHDATLERTTNGRGRVRQASLSEVRALRAGPHGERVPLVDDVIALVDALPLVIELHDDEPAVVTALAQCLARLPAAARDRLIVASEHSSVVEGVRDVCVVNTAASRKDVWRKVLCAWLHLPHRASHVFMVPETHRGLTVVSRRFTEGSDVWVFVVNDVAECLRLRALGATGCFTTQPRHLTSAWSRDRVGGTQ